MITNPNPRIERLRECGLDCVDEAHCVRDTVEGQSSSTVIHVHSYSTTEIQITPIVQRMGFAPILQPMMGFTGRSVFMLLCLNE